MSLLRTHEQQFPVDVKKDQVEMYMYDIMVLGGIHIPNYMVYYVFILYLYRTGGVHLQQHISRVSTKEYEK